MKKSYLTLVKHYESCLEKHGDNHLGVDWPNLEDVEKRYKVMLDILSFRDNFSQPISVLDFGCGTAHLLEYIKSNKYQNIQYSGLDISQKFIDVAKMKYTDNLFFCMDILDKKNKLEPFDYFVLNGVFTEKRELSFDEMWKYFSEMITVLYDKCNRGIAFNVMSKNVDWERKDLFHVPHDLLTQFLCKNITRDYVIRNDYGLYEYTVYIFKN